MAKYLFEATYTHGGVEGLLSDGGSARAAVVQKAAESLGGSVEGFWFAFGETDAFVVVDLPDNESAAALSLTVGASGKVRTSVVALLTPEELDAAAAKHPSYKPPGG